MVKKEEQDCKGCERERENESPCAQLLLSSRKGHSAWKQTMTQCNRKRERKRERERERKCL